MSSAKNFGYGTVLTAPSPATTGTSLVLNSAQGALFPTVPFNATIWPVGVRPTAANAEVVTVTAISTDTLTITRAQEGSSARTIIVGDQVAATITANVMVQSNRFTPTTSATQNITLDGSTDFMSEDTVEVGSGYTLELPATSTLEVVPIVKQAEVQSYFGMFDFIESGCTWSADSAGSSLNGTMTDGYVWISGRRLRVNAVRSRAFTASKDTYIDFSDNGDGTAKITYTETTNNLSTGSPTLAAGSLRNAIIITAAGSIAATTSINQGQESMILPIVSSIAYSVTDSLGNLICPRDPHRKLLGMRQIVANFTTTSASLVDITGLTCPVIIPAGRKVRLTTGADYTSNSAAAGNGSNISFNDATAAVEVKDIALTTPGAGYAVNPSASIATTPPAAGARTYKVQAKIAGGATFTYATTATSPAYIMVELE